MSATGRWQAEDASVRLHTDRFVVWLFVFLTRFKRNTEELPNVRAAAEKSTQLDLKAVPDGIGSSRYFHATNDGNTHENLRERFTKVTSPDRAELL